MRSLSFVIEDSKSNLSSFDHSCKKDLTALPRICIRIRIINGDKNESEFYRQLLLF